MAAHGCFQKLGLPLKGGSRAPLEGYGIDMRLVPARTTWLFSIS